MRRRGESYQRKESKMEEKEGKERNRVNKTGWRKGKHTVLTTTALSPKL